jgi:hypothetical protein
VSRRLAPAIVVLLSLAPAMARGQTNIDQGMTPAQMFAGDCAVCHKGIRGLANGRSASALSSFLSEHYTASRDQAAALAAYVLSRGGEGGRPAPVRAQAPRPEHAKTAAEERKKSTRREPRRGKLRGRTRATAKLQRQTDEEVKPAAPSAVERPVQPVPATPANRAGQPTQARQQPASATATPAPSPKKEPKAVPPAPEPASVAAAPATGKTPSQDASATAAQGIRAGPPTTARRDQHSLVPRDDIPD